MTKQYNHIEAEKSWQEAWLKSDSFKFDPNSPKEKYYVLEMFPYPSGEIHMGHLRNYAIGDALARFKKLQGLNVIHPMGFDSFGLPAENAALEHQIHPEDWTLKNIEVMKQGLKSIGLAIDWDMEVVTCLPEYFKHEQKIFIDFVKQGLAYQKESEVNWDPVDQTVLANEQVIDGRGWRSGALVEKKKLKQWFLKVSEFSEELLLELKNLPGWDEKVLNMQEKWIGKSEGLLIDFALDGMDEKITVYTTRPDTIYGASFIGIAPDHPIATKIAQSDEKVAEFIEECSKSLANQRDFDQQEKKGYKTSLKVSHPLDDSTKLDVYIANFVLMDYGSGAIFACPAHDERDYEFATKYNLAIKQVVSPKSGKKVELPYLEEGVAINSGDLDGLSTADAKEKVATILSKQGIASKKTNYRLRDWGVSRQRYWGCPIPMLYLEDGSVVPVPEDELPVTLPRDVEFDGNGNPLANHDSWKHTTYQGQKAIRETDTFDTFFESSWYFLRYLSKEDDQAFDGDLVNKFMPVDQYIGGVEHAVLHLLYARFFTKALKKCGYLDFDEPFKSLLTQGMVCHQTYKGADGKWLFPEDAIKKDDGKYYHKETGESVKVGRSEKMSKSKKNVVKPSKIINEYGADTARLFMLSDSPPARDLEWSDGGIDGCYKYINRLWRLAEQAKDYPKSDNLNEYSANELLRFTHKTISQVKSEYENMGFNRAIAKTRELSNLIEKSSVSSNEDKLVISFALKNLIILISPIIPHLSEELWSNLGYEGLVVDQDYPKFNPELLSEDIIKIAVQVCGKLRAVIEVAKDTSKEEIEQLAKDNDNVKKFTQGKEVKKVIVVPGKLVNIVAV